MKPENTFINALYLQGKKNGFYEWRLILNTYWVPVERALVHTLPARNRHRKTCPLKPTTGGEAGTPTQAGQSFTPPLCKICLLFLGIHFSARSSEGIRWWSCNYYSVFYFVLLGCCCLLNSAFQTSIYI